MKNTNIKDLISIVSGLEEDPRDKSIVNSYNPKGIRNPFTALPNVKSFKVVTNNLDPLLAEYGISRKLDPELIVDRLNHRIRGTNRYLFIIFERSTRLLAAGRVKHFWLLSFMLMRRSKAIRLSALRQLETNWWKVFEIHKVHALLTHLNRFLIGGARKFLLKRRYEDKIKPDGTKTYRPIGAPSYGARMLLYVLYCFFSIFLGSYIGNYQHAYRRGKGVVSAWRDLANKIYKYENIYEFDLSQFFPGVNNSYIMWKLTELGLPKPFADWVFDLNLEYPAKDTLDETKLDETNAKERAELDAIGLLRMDFQNKRKAMLSLTLETSEVLKPIWNFVKENAFEQFNQRYKTEINNMTSSELLADCFANVEELLISMMSEDLGYSPAEIKQYWLESLFEYYQVQAALFESFKPAAKPTPITTEDIRPGGKEAPFNTINLFFTRGLPQGGSISTILSIFAFDYTLVKTYFEQIFGSPRGQGWDIVAYADDFLLMWNKSGITQSDITQPSDALDAMGISFNLEKSGPIKTKGEWVAEKFKFLGKTFYPKSQIVVGTPRSGKVNFLNQTDAIQLFGKRHQLLESIAKEFSLPMKPQEILNAWGREEFPFNCLPTELMQDAIPLNTAQRRFFSVALNSQCSTFAEFEEKESKLVEDFRNGIHDPEVPIIGPAPAGFPMGGKGMTFDEFLGDLSWSESRPPKGSEPADLLEYKGKSDSSEGGPFDYLSYPDISGFVTTRLHDKGFVTDRELASMLPQAAPKKFKKGYNNSSWASYMRLKPKGTHLNMFNSSSYATLSLIKSNLFNTMSPSKPKKLVGKPKAK